MARSHIRLAVLLPLVHLAACGGGPAAPATDGEPVTRTFTGSTRVAENGGCASLTPSNAFNTGEGTLTLRLEEASAPRLMVQVCAVGEANHTQCTVPPFAILATGHGLSATVRGGRTQIVTVYPEGCGGRDSLPTPPITYTISIVHPR